MSSGSNISLFSGFFLALFNGIAYSKTGSLTVPILANVGFMATIALSIFDL